MKVFVNFESVSSRILLLKTSVRIDLGYFFCIVCVLEYDFTTSNFIVFIVNEKIRIIDSCYASRILPIS